MLRHSGICSGILFNQIPFHGLRERAAEHIILGELEKIATHYGIIRHGRMIKEMTAEELEADCPTYIALKTREGSKIKLLLHGRFNRVEEDEDGSIRIYGDVKPEDVVWSTDLFVIDHVALKTVLFSDS